MVTLVNLDPPVPVRGVAAGVEVREAAEVGPGVGEVRARAMFPDDVGDGVGGPVLGTHSVNIRA